MEGTKRSVIFLKAKKEERTQKLSGVRSSFLLKGKLAVIQHGIKPVLVKQLLMITLLNDISVLHNENYVCFANGR